MSDNENMKQVPSPKGAVRTGKFYPDHVKLEAVKLWLITGNLRAVSASMDIPYNTLQPWRYSKWWGELANDIRTEGHIALSQKMRKIAEKAMDVTLDRLEQGDWVFNQKTGRMDRKPVAMRDAHQAAISFSDRALKLEDKPHNEAAVQQVNDRLAALAEAFTKMANKTRKVEVLDVSFTQHEDGKSQEAGSFSQEEAESPEEAQAVQGVILND